MNSYREPLYLSRYLEAMRDRLPSRFLITKSIGVDFDRDSPIRELWEMHNEAMKVFRER
ncbi:Uncharacterised protein [uncultured archaeon]|nr:Uncharacterised protein [uncultured archaeon]